MHFFFSNDHYNNASTINTAKDKSLSKNLETTDTKRKVSDECHYKLFYT